MLKNSAMTSRRRNKNDPLKEPNFTQEVEKSPDTDVCVCVCSGHGSQNCVHGCGSGHGFSLAQGSFIMASTFDITRKLVCELKQVSPVPTAAW